MNDLDILIEELNIISDKWAQRLNYQGRQGKDPFDCLLCSTVIYEIERAKQKANLRIAKERQNKIDAKREKATEKGDK